MGGIAELLKIVLERSMFASFFVGIFCGIVMVGAQFGLEVPPVVMTWLFVAFAACASLLLCQGSVVAHRRFVRAKRAEADRLASEERRIEEARRNMSSLYREEVEVLLTLLEDGSPRRFEVGMYSAAEGMVRKGILVPVRRGPMGTTICEVDQTIFEHREQIVLEFRAALERRPTADERY